MNAKHTPGPWYWHFDGQACASLRTPDRGNLIVMDFIRQGMQSAAPRFAIWPGIEAGEPRERLGGIMKPLPQIAGGVLSLHWTQPVHPDARLIAAAPDLLKACQELLSWYEDSHGLDFCECDNSVDYTCRACQARAAIAKATNVNVSI